MLEESGLLLESGTYDGRHGGFWEVVYGSSYRSVLLRPPFPALGNIVLPTSISMGTCTSTHFVMGCR